MRSAALPPAAHHLPSVWHFTLLPLDRISSYLLLRIPFSTTRCLLPPDSASALLGWDLNLPTTPRFRARHARTLHALPSRPAAAHSPLRTARLCTRTAHYAYRLPPPRISPCPLARRYRRYAHLTPHTCTFAATLRAAAHTLHPVLHAPARLSNNAGAAYTTPPHHLFACDAMTACPAPLFMPAHSLGRVDAQLMTGTSGTGPVAFGPGILSPRAAALRATYTAAPLPLHFHALLHTHHSAPRAHMRHTRTAHLRSDSLDVNKRPFQHPSYTRSATRGTASTLRARTALPAAPPPAFALSAQRTTRPAGAPHTLHARAPRAAGVGPPTNDSPAGEQRGCLTLPTAFSTGLPTSSCRFLWYAV